ncbi:MAG: ketoacyl-ACP synthase III [Sphingobacteriales bacterium]|nr:ketoacyl-ACP synthase III [Sphingobacteriales bacterium]
MKRTKISGIGHYVPERVISNADLEQMMDTTDAWIRERTGIEQRRWAVAGQETTASMATAAARRALENAGLTPEDVDFIIVATISPDHYFPGTGVLVQHQLGIREIGALDVRNQCSGFVYALSVGDQFVKAGTYKTVLVIGSELHSHGLEKTTRGRNVSVIFGDGAAAVVLQASDNDSGILSTHLHAQGAFAEELMVKDPGNLSAARYPVEGEALPESYYPYMNGNLVFKHAVVRFEEVINEALAHNGLQATDIDLLVPHQANYRIIQFLQRKMNLPEEKVVSNIQQYGNTTAASIPLALSQAHQTGRLQKGNLVCLAAFGSGFTWASALLRW